VYIFVIVTKHVTIFFLLPFITSHFSLIKMLKTLAVAVVALLALGVNAQLMINTPSGVTQCQNSQLTWSGTTDPVQISVLPGGQISAQPLELLPSVASGNAQTWLCDIQANIQVTFAIRDVNTGQVAYSGLVTILAGSNSTCIGKNPPPGVATGVTGPPATTPAGPPATTPASPTTPAGGASSVPTTPSAPSFGISKSPAATATPSGAASHSYGVSLGTSLFGLLAVFIAAF